MKQLYNYTQYLVISALILSAISYTKNKLFKTSEVYPFFWWQLFTNPAKGDTPFTMLRLYEIRDNDTIRLANDGSNLDNVIYSSLLNEAYNKIERNDSNKNINQFVQRIGIQKTNNPSSRFILIKEIYLKPITITKDHHEFEKEILFISSSR